MHHVHAEALSARERGESQGSASSVAMRPSLAVAPPRWGVVGQLTIWAVKLPAQQKEIRLRSRIRLGLGAIEARPTEIEIETKSASTSTPSELSTGTLQACSCYRRGRRQWTAVSSLFGFYSSYLAAVGEAFWAAAATNSIALCCRGNNRKVNLLCTRLLMCPVRNWIIY
jgi:hypothetical protein